MQTWGRPERGSKNPNNFRTSHVYGPKVGNEPVTLKQSTSDTSLIVGTILSNTGAATVLEMVVNTTVAAQVGGDSMAYIICGRAKQGVSSIGFFDSPKLGDLAQS